MPTTNQPIPKLEDSQNELLDSFNAFTTLHIRMLSQINSKDQPKHFDDTRLVYTLRK